MTIQANFPNLRPSLLLDFQNTKQLDPRITFTRASTGGFYNGVTTAMAEQNLLLRSQDYSATWTVTSLTPVTAKTAPDGTSTATEFTATAANAVLTQGYTAIAGSYTFSVFLRRVTGSGDIQIAADNGTWTTKVITGTWARYDVTQTVAAGAKTAGVRVVTDTDAIEVWGAQVEQRSAVTAYTATTTQAITNYIPVLQTAASGVARFDNNPTTGESLGLLIEESRTNICLYSSDLSNAAWTKTNATVTSNTIVAPDGTLTGDKIVDDTTLGNHSASQGSITFANATSYTITLYAKAGEISYIKIGRVTGTAFPSLPTAYFNLTTATVLGSPNANWTNYSITDVGNGWRRCSATVLTTGSGTDGIAIFLTDSSGNTGFTGNNYNGAYIWGAQFETGAFATSYIPTVASQVTRAADAASMTGTNFSTWYNQAQGTLYGDWLASGANAYSNVLAVSDGTVNNYLAILRNNSNTSIKAENVVGGVAVSGITQTISGFVGTQLKGVSAYSANDFAATFNGSAAGVDTSGNIPSTINRLIIGQGATASFSNEAYNGTIKKIAYYPLRVTNAQLQSLTS